MNSIQSFLETNLLALTSNNLKLSVRTGRSKKNNNVKFRETKSGEIVPIFNNKGINLPLHSLVNPIRESQRFYSTFTTGGYLLFLGLGAAYHITPFLVRDDISGILIVDTDIKYFRSLLEIIDLRQLLLDKRTNLLIDPNSKELESFLLSNYLPAVCGDLHIIPLRSRIQIESAFFNSVVDTVKQTIASLSEDYSVQSYFGKRWFLNTTMNMEKAEKSTTTLKPIKTALITGAGPSLEEQIPQIKEAKKHGQLIATDTSLPTLIQSDVIPDLIISIDCQHITYHHFMIGLPQHIPLVLDLASPRGLTELSDSIVFFTSGHPFSKYVNSYWRRFPYIDTSGGNVSHAAVSLADSLGAKEIYLYGIDFSFPQGKSYAKGTYLYPFFSTSAFRTSSLESKFVSFLLRNREIVRCDTNYGYRYTTKPMISYKKRLEDFSSQIHAPLSVVPGKGEKLIPKKPLSEQREKRIFSAGFPVSDWKTFLKQYNEGLNSLPEPGESLSEYIEKLTPEQRDICTTLYPASATLRKETDRDDFVGAKIIKEAIIWTQEVIRTALAK